MRHQCRHQCPGAEGSGLYPSTEGKTILGAAVVDDVLGLIILAVVVALIGSSSAPTAGVFSIAAQIGVIVLKAFGFLIVGTVLGILFQGESTDGRRASIFAECSSPFR